MYFKIYVVSFLCERQILKPFNTILALKKVLIVQIKCIVINHCHVCQNNTHVATACSHLILQLPRISLILEISLQKVYTII